MPSRECPEDTNSRPKVIDLFSGAGGLSLGAARAGFNVAGAVERDTHAAATHARNFPQTAHLQADLSNLSAADILFSLGLTRSDVKGVIGGPPCQGFSCIGHQKNDDPRNELFVDFFRLVKELRPHFFLAENVPGLLDEGNTGILTRALEHVKDYNILEPLTLCAKDFGVPTTRTRVFIVGYLSNEVDHLAVVDFSPPKDAENITVRAALKGLPRRIDPLWQAERDGWRISRAIGTGYFATRLQGKVPTDVGDPIALEKLRRHSKSSGNLGTRHSAAVSKRYASIKHGKRDKISKSHRLDLDGFCPTLRAGTGKDRGRFQAVRPLHPTQSRVITPREAARLQGFPDWFRFSPEKWHSFREIGASVSPILAERLLATILECLTTQSAEAE